MTKIHVGKAKCILSLADGKLAFVELYLHFQHIVLRLQAMFVGTLHILHQFLQYSMIALRYLIHLLCFDHEYVCLIGLQNHLCSSEGFVELGHLFAESSHLIGSQYLSTHEDGLFHLHTTHPHGANLVIQVDTGKVSKATVGHRHTAGIGKESRQVSSGNREGTICRTIKPRSASCEIGKKISPITLLDIVCSLYLLGSCFHTLIVFQSQLSALVKSKNFLCACGERTDYYCDESESLFHFLL